MRANFMLPASNAILIFITAYCVLLFWLLIRARRNYTSLPLMVTLLPQDPPPDCMVVIPARDEESNIGRVVKSFPPDTVIVVDDGSTDGTVKEAEAAGAGVLPIQTIRKGESGKANACMTGAKALTSRWILFADADTWYEPGFLDSAVAIAEANGYSFLSFQLQYEPNGWIEEILVPYATALFYSGLDPQKRPSLAFNGQCVLARRDSYQFIGGHSSGTVATTDDVGIALAAERHRMKKNVLRATHVGHSNLHRGWSGLNEGIRRNALRFSQQKVALGMSIVLTAILSAMWLPISVLLAFNGQPVAAIGIALLPSILLWPWYRNWKALVLAPISTYLMLPIVGRAALLGLLSPHADWKGRSL